MDTYILHLGEGIQIPADSLKAIKDYLIQGCRYKVFGFPTDEDFESTREWFFVVQDIECDYSLLECSIEKI